MPKPKSLEARLERLEQRAGLDRQPGQPLYVIFQDEAGNVLKGAEHLGPGGERLPGRHYLTVVYVDTKKEAKNARKN